MTVRGGARGSALADDDGSVLPLLIGATALALSLVLVVAGAASLYLERKRLLGLADAAARVGAEAFPLDAVEVGATNQLTVELAPTDVHHAVSVFLGEQSLSRFEALELVEAGSLDGRSATVTLTSWWRPPLLGPVLPEGLTIEATATARTVFH